MDCRLLALLSALLATAGAAGQEPAPKRTLAELRQSMADRFRAAQRAENRYEAVQAALRTMAAEVEGFLEHEADADDRHNARLLLVDTYLNLGDRERAGAALRQLDTAAAPPMVVLAGAELAAVLGLTELRGEWIDLALRKPAAFEERMAMGMHLLTAMREVEKGERVFAEAYAKAVDDEQRAKVRWFQVAALREREDRSDDAYYEALEKLAAEFGDTEYGSIAKDRIAAAEHAVGRQPVPLTLRTTDGKTLRTAGFAGRVLVLSFWASWSESSLQVQEDLRQLHEKLADRGLAVVGISVDDDAAAAAAAAASAKLPWPQVCEGNGWQSPAALRYNIEAVPNVMVIDRDGKIAGMNLFPVGEAGRRELEEVIDKALGKSGG